MEKALRSGGRKAEALKVDRAMVVIKTTRYQDEMMLLAGKDSWQEVLQDTMMISRLDTLLAKEGFDVEALKKGKAESDRSPPAYSESVGLWRSGRGRSALLRRNSVSNSLKRSASSTNSACPASRNTATRVPGRLLRRCVACPENCGVTT